MRTLITGASGFVGTHLIPLFLQEGIELTTLSRTIVSEVSRNMRHYAGDILDQALLVSILKTRSIDSVIHLAGGRAEDNQRAEIYKLNTLSTASLMDAIVKTNQNIKCIVLSSSAVYGNGERDDPSKKITEENKLYPIDNYAESKLASEFIAQLTYRQNKVPIIIARLFNTIGPGQNEKFIAGKIVQHMANRIVKKKDEILNMGPILLGRDFLDVRDVATALMLLLKKGQIGEIYNICSGKTEQIKSIIEHLNDLTGIELLYNSTDLLENKEVKIKSQTGCNNKIIQMTEWQPKISFKQSLSDQLQAKIEEVKNK